MSEIVPASTRVRPSRVHNIDTNRLLRRLVWMRVNQPERMRKIDGHSGSGRGGLADSARELILIERELAKRGALPEIYTYWLRDLQAQQAREL